MFDLADGVVLVTGSSRGIGRAIALEVARAGGDVVLHGQRRSASLTDASRAVRKLGREVRSVVGDVQRPAAVTKLVERAGAWKGRLDGLVTSAGLYRGEDLESTGKREWEEILRTDLEGTFRCVQAARPWLECSTHPSIVTVSSIMASHPAAGAYAYQAAKAGLEQLTRALALELAPRIRVNAVAPGFVRTDMNRGGHEDPEFSTYIAEHTPLHRWAEPEDIAPAVRYLLSREASWVTGSVLAVDGGAGLR